MTRSTLRRTSAAAVAVLALASVAACGGDDGGGGAESSESAGSDSSSEPTDAASDASESGDPTETPDRSGNAGDDESEEPVDEGEPIANDKFVDIYLASMEGVRTATIELRFGGPGGVEGSGVADFTTDPTSMQLTVTDPNTKQDQEMVVVDGKLYLGISPKKFIEYDLSDPGSPLGTALTDQMDPTALADKFEAGIIRSAYLGEEEIDGETMKHYRATIKASAVYGELPPGTDDEELTLDMWFDEAGSFRRQGVAGNGPGGDVVLDYDNWGAPVEIEAPPAAQVTSLPSS